jgi:SAM-dependent methyltransferase
VAYPSARSVRGTGWDWYSAVRPAQFRRAGDEGAPSVAPMVRRVSLGELAISTAGVALRRAIFTGSDQDAKAAIELIARAMAALSDPPWNYGYKLVEADPSTGYGVIAGNYDRAGGPDIDAEQPVMWNLFDGLSPGRAVDVACGTGRHLARLAELGHQVVGVDRSPEMLVVARQRMPHAPLWLGAMERLPVRSASSDLTVCSLAIEHEPDPEPVVADLARVTRVGGRVLISDVHPFAILLDHQAQFESASGGRVLIRAYPHLHGRLLKLFGRNGLVVEQCLEPTMSPGPGLSGRACQGLVGDRVTAAAWTGLPIVVVWQLRREGIR